MVRNFKELRLNLHIDIENEANSGAYNTLSKADKLKFYLVQLIVCVTWVRFRKLVKKKKIGITPQQLNKI